MTAGATQSQDLVLGWIFLGVTILERLGSRAAVMAEVEAKIMTAVNGIDLNVTVSTDKIVSFTDRLQWSGKRHVANRPNPV